MPEFEFGSTASLIGQLNIPNISGRRILLKIGQFPYMLGNGSSAPDAAFGKVLRRARRAAGMSQEALGLESGVQRNFISLIETGQNQPTITTIFKLATALNIKPSKLVADTEKMVS